MILRTHGLAKHFPIRDFLGRVEGQVRALDGVTLTLPEGKTLGIVGESGCGKTTLARTLLGLEAPTAGSVELGPALADGLAGDRLEELRLSDLRRLRRRIGVVFQDPLGALNPRMLVKDLVTEPLVIHGETGGLRDRARELLELVGLNPDHLYRFPHQFSGGQRQRIVIARALALEPQLLVLDEPTSALDVSVQAQILNLLQQLQRNLGLSFLFISHDLAVVKHMCDRVAVMYLGRVVEEADAAQLFANPRHPYSQALVSATPELDPARRQERIVLEGDVPSPAAPPSGCHFHPRCPIAVDRCAGEYPELREGEGCAVACHLV